jgi:hypothetical protein
MRAFIENLVQLGMLGLGISLLLVCINYLKPGADRKADEGANTCRSRSFAGSAVRGRNKP